MKAPSAVRVAKISYQAALNKQLKIMDAAAFSLCMENNIPIVVFDFFKENGMVEVIEGKDSGTLVTY
jgi:uridylate kinase